LTSFRLADRIHAHPNLFFPPGGRRRPRPVSLSRDSCGAREAAKCPGGAVQGRHPPGLDRHSLEVAIATGTYDVRRRSDQPSPTRCHTIGAPSFRMIPLVSTVWHAKAWTRGLTGSPPLLDGRNDGAWLGRCARGRDGRSAFSRRSRNQGRSPCPSRSRRNPRRRPVRVPTPTGARVARSTCSSLRCFQWSRRSYWVWRLLFGRGRARNNSRVR
jgi:hypothetical protein